MKIAMWSGPRNLSTAMMYSFASRSDFAVWDEPFYAPYLDQSGIDHPMRSDILSAHERDPHIVAQQICDSNKSELPHYYMKHMSLHMLDCFPLDWALDCVNVHLIRHPARVIASYSAKREWPSLDDIGYRQQVEVYEQFPGPVIDSYDIRKDPEAVLRMLCDEIGLSWDSAMLGWPEGPKSFDGVWAKHWYGVVHRSTGFADAEGELPELKSEMRALERAAMPYYEVLRDQSHKS